MRKSFVMLRHFFQFFGEGGVAGDTAGHVGLLAGL